MPLETFPELMIPPIVRHFDSHSRPPSCVLFPIGAHERPKLVDARSASVFHQLVIVEPYGVWTMAVVGEREPAASRQDDLYAPVNTGMQEEILVLTSTMSGAG